MNDSYEMTNATQPTLPKPIIGRIVGSVVGFIVAIPTSYFFQDSMIRSKMSLGDYLEMLPKLFTSSSSGGSKSGDSLDRAFNNIAQNIGENIMTTLIITVVAGLVIGFVVGYLIDKSNASSAK